MVSRRTIVLIVGLPAFGFGASAHGQSDEVATALSSPTKPADARDFDKYFYFYRTGTDFESALADLRACDALASGLTPNAGKPAIFSGLATAVLSSEIAAANRRALRRISLRRCMFFKGYGRYGISKATWQMLNPETDATSLNMGLSLRARAASGTAPASMDLGE